MRAELKHLGGMAFETRLREFSLKLDTSGVGTRGEGPTPKESLLASIMACSAMDVVGWLRKEKVGYESFDMEASAEQTTEHPKVFIQVDLSYRFTGKDLPLNKLREAVELSMTKYCGVSAMVSKVVPLYFVILVNGQIEHRGQAQFY